MLKALECRVSQTDVFIDDPSNTRFGLIREKDMPALLRRTGGIAFMGSDNFAEISEGDRVQYTYEPIALGSARFALMVREDRGYSLGQETTLKVATSYPTIADTALKRIGRPFSVDLVVTGSVEAMPYLDPSINAVFDLVSSGETLRANGLTIAEDNLASVQIGAVWRS